GGQPRRVVALPQKPLPPGARDDGPDGLAEQKAVHQGGQLLAALGWRPLVTGRDTEFERHLDQLAVVLEDALGEDPEQGVEDRRTLLLPKPGYRYPDSAPEPDVRVSPHPAPQLLGTCHVHLVCLQTFSRG